MQIRVKHDGGDGIFEILINNRNIDANDRSFFHPAIGDLHDPFLMPDMEEAVERILKAREKNERVVIFGDYDVDGVSGTAILVRFLTDLGMQVSYRLPHRVHDGYGLKKYFFDELKEKNVQLVITVDCGTRDIEVIEYAKNLGVDVIVTDHHAVPERIPEGVPVLNPKRHDSKYPFPNLAGAGVAFKLLHGLLITMSNQDIDTHTQTQRNQSIVSETMQESTVSTGYSSLSSVCVPVSSNLLRYIDFASLGTVADCMPLIGENRTITTLGLKQMKHSHSHGLRKFLEGNEKVDGNADVIGFQIGPRINAAGRMDTPLTALRWLLASEERCDEFLEEIEELNAKRQKVVKDFAEQALMEVNPDDGILFFIHDELEHGIIGLIAGKLTEAYNRPSIVLCKGKKEEKKNTGNREYESMMKAPNGESEGDKLSESEGKQEEGGAGASAPQGYFQCDEVAKGQFLSPSGAFGAFQSGKVQEKGNQGITLVASCRSPEWCNLVELLDVCKDLFVRYGGHRQAAGFTIETEKLPAFQEKISAIFREKYNMDSLPEKTLEVESTLDPSQATLETLGIINRFRPFGIGNPKPLWLLENITIASVKYLGNERKHLSLNIVENPNLRLLYWNSGEKKGLLEVGNIVSLVIELEENEWNGKMSVQATIKEILK